MYIVYILYRIKLVHCMINNTFCKFFDEKYSDVKSNIKKISTLAAISVCGCSLACQALQPWLTSVRGNYSVLSGRLGGSNLTLSGSTIKYFSGKINSSTHHISINFYICDWKVKIPFIHISKHFTFYCHTPHMYCKYQKKKWYWCFY